MRNFETNIVNSALWAAAGDAIGWITELTDLRGLERRAGVQVLTEPVSWRRKVGGIGGALVELAPGTYSDDTQLRLAVSRSIRGDGVFDAEVFAKIELPVWLSYSLGAGRGSKAAAANLAKRDVNWFSNFFTDSGREYPNTGGNGAAMRIQPHVWKFAGQTGRPYAEEVVKDALITHGHMRGVCGALFHADCVAYALRYGKAPSPDQWRMFTKNFEIVEHIVKSDPQLARFWLPTWERMSDRSIGEAINSTIDETLGYLNELERIEWGQVETYARVLETLDAFSAERIGTGTNTAIAAVALCWDRRSDSLEDTILLAANAIGTDTDTITSMAGAVLGAMTDVEPPWPIQDWDYIVMEARRMAALARGEKPNTFAYPDLIDWQAPSNFSDTVALFNGQPALAGLGPLIPEGKKWDKGEFAWQWYRTSFGQHVLCKTRSVIKKEFNQAQMPDHARKIDRAAVRHSPKNQSFSRPLPFDQQDSTPVSRPSAPAKVSRERTVDELFAIASQSGLDASVVGMCLLEIANGHSPLERSAAFAALVARAANSSRRPS